MTENANFGPNLVDFGQKIPILTQESKSFGTHITEKTPSPSAPSVQALRLEKPLKKAFAFLYSMVISQTSIRAMWWWELKRIFVRNVVLQAEEAI